MPLSPLFVGEKTVRLARGNGDLIAAQSKEVIVTELVRSHRVRGLDGVFGKWRTSGAERSDGLSVA